MATPDDIIEARKAAAARRATPAPATPAIDSAAFAAQIAAMPTASAGYQQGIQGFDSAAAKSAAAQAKKDAEAALLAATGKTTLVAAQKAAAAKDISSNPAVIAANKALAEANAAAEKATADLKARQNVLVEDKGVRTFTATDGRTFNDLDTYQAYQARLDEQKAERKSAYDLLFEQFNKYGLGGLVTPLRGLIESGISPSEFTIKLRETQAYQNRFAANAQRIAKGLSPLSEAEYIGLEDQYQNIMRNYGLPASYYARGDMGRQAGFEKFIAGDVSAAELEDRIQTAQNRVINAAPQVSQALKQFYPDITNGDILAYALDPEKALTELRRKVTAAEIGGAALQAGLQTGMSRAEELQKYGVNQQMAQQGFQTIAGGLERGRQLSQIYQQPEYTQTTAEQEVFQLPSAAEARKKRQDIINLEKKTFEGTTGVTGGTLSRDRAGQY